MSAAAKIYRKALADFQREFWDSYYFPPQGQFNIAEMQRLDAIIINGIIEGDEALTKAANKGIEQAVSIHDDAFVAVELALKRHKDLSPVAQASYVLIAIRDAGLNMFRKQSPSRDTNK